ncbi:MAG: tyrosine-type recombinase/integrase [Candidatus Nanoarchaeia archaeon]
MKRKLPEVLTEEESIKLIEACSTIRDRMMVKLMLFTGLRVSELLNIKFSDFDFKEAVITVRKGKGGKERLQPIPQVFLKELKSFVDLSSNKEFPDAYVFTNNKGFRLSPQAVWNIIKVAAFKAKIMKNIHPHTLRHTYATRIYERYGDLKRVQTLLDHEQLSTSSIYTHLSTKKKKETVNEVFK